MIPLFFQVVLQDSPSQAGIRLVIPSLATPIGGLLAGVVMSRYGRLSELVRFGCFMMMLGNALVACLKYEDSTWKYFLYLFPANLGQGVAYPSILFTFLAAFDHSGKSNSSVSFEQNSEIFRQNKLCRRPWYIFFAPWVQFGELQHLQPSFRMFWRNNFLSHLLECQTRSK